MKIDIAHKQKTLKNVLFFKVFCFAASTSATVAW